MLFHSKCHNVCTLKTKNKLAAMETEWIPFISNIILSYENRLFRYKQRMKTYTSHDCVILKGVTLQFRCLNRQIIIYSRTFYTLVRASDSRQYAWFGKTLVRRHRNGCHAQITEFENGFWTRMVKALDVCTNPQDLEKRIRFFNFYDCVSQPFRHYGLLEELLISSGPLQYFDFNVVYKRESNLKI